MSKLRHYDDWDLMYELEKRGYDLSDVPTKSKEDSLDLIDEERLEQIIDKFCDANWQQREEIWKIVKGL